MTSTKGQLTAINFHSVCHQVANQLKFPLPFICYLLFEKLYAENTEQALVFLIESELTGYLYRNHGRFELIPTDKEELFQFQDGRTIAKEGADITWVQFFELSYIDCSAEQISRINAAIDIAKAEQSDLQ